MGLDEAAILSPNRGGAPHQLPRLLKALDKEDAEIMRRLFGMPMGDVDHTRLRRQLIDIDPQFSFSASTLRRWHEEALLQPERFFS